MKKTLIFTTSLLFIFVSIIGYFLYKKYNDNYHNLDFEYVASYNINNIQLESVGHHWFTFRDEKYYPFYEAPLNSINCFSDIDDATVYDFNKYTYIIVCGYEMKKIQYSNSSVNHYILGLIPDQYIGRVYLKNKQSKVFIYKIKKMNIDCDIHDKKNNIFFIN